MIIYKIKRFISLFTLTSLIMLTSPLATADEVVTCKSNGYKYTRCSTIKAGYVTLKKQLSSTSCQQGRTWDYDRRGIWVDDGCKGEFLVETYGNGNKSNSSDAKAAAGLLIGAILLGALTSSSDVEDEYKYKDDDYYGSRHTSYVPDWMVGKFEGYNADYGKNVSLTIKSNGKVKARSSGQNASGWINDERLHIGGVVFDIEKNRRGFITSQKGVPHNEVIYRRVN